MNVNGVTTSLTPATQVSGLGNSATRNVGTTNGTVAAGDDSGFPRNILANDGEIIVRTAGAPAAFATSSLGRSLVQVASAADLEALLRVRRRFGTGSGADSAWTGWAPDNGSTGGGSASIAGGRARLVMQNVTNANGPTVGINLVGIVDPRNWRATFRVLPSGVVPTLTNAGSYVGLLFVETEQANPAAGVVLAANGTGNNTVMGVGSSTFGVVTSGGGWTNGWTIANHLWLRIEVRGGTVSLFAANGTSNATLPADGAWRTMWITPLSGWHGVRTWPTYLVLYGEQYSSNLASSVTWEFDDLTLEAL